MLYTPPEPVTAVAFTISIEQGLMPFTETVTVGAGRAVFSGREQSAFAFPTYQDSMLPGASTAPSSVRSACATRFVLTPVGSRTRRPSGRSTTRRIRVGGQRVGGRPRTMKAARSASRHTRTSCVLARRSPMPSFRFHFHSGNVTNRGRTCARGCGWRRILS